MESFAAAHLSYHPTINMMIDGQSCEIDVGIAPVVAWLNTLPGIRTVYSCQGGATPEGHTTPYVMMNYDNLKSVERIAQLVRTHTYSIINGRPTVRRFNHVVLELDYFMSRPRLVMEWTDPENLARFISLLEEQR